MEIKTKKNYIIEITHKERGTIMDALVHAIDRSVNKAECTRLLDEFTNHNEED